MKDILNALKKARKEICEQIYYSSPTKEISDRYISENDTIKVIDKVINKYSQPPKQ